MSTCSTAANEGFITLIQGTQSKLASSKELQKLASSNELRLCMVNLFMLRSELSEISALNLQHTLCVEFAAN